MISNVAPFIVAAAFCVAVVSVWVSKPINNRGIFHDTGYDESNPPTPKEWRSARVRYTVLLVFLGVLFTVGTYLSLSVVAA